MALPNAVLRVTLHDVDPDGLTAKVWYSEGAIFPYYVEEHGKEVYHVSFSNAHDAMNHALRVTNNLEEGKTMRTLTLKSDVVYEVENDERGLLAQVVTSSNIMWRYRVIVHDVNEGEVVFNKGFKTKTDAETYADSYVFGG